MMIVLVGMISLLFFFNLIFIGEIEIILVGSSFIGDLVLIVLMVKCLIVLFNFIRKFFLVLYFF